MKKSKSVFPIFGGKNRLVNRILPLLPSTRVFVDAFGGAGNVILNREPSKLDVFNDIDSNVVNFFKQLRGDSDRLIQQIELTPHSREEYYFCRDNVDAVDDDFERARRFYTTANQCFGGVIRQYNSGWTFDRKGKTSSAKRWANKPEVLMGIVTRLKQIQIENVSFEKLFELYDGDEALFYCDPPYLDKTRQDAKAYTHEMNEIDHFNLLVTINNCKAKVALSGYESEMYNDLLPNDKWNKTTFETTTTFQQGRKSTARIETLWMNY